MSRGRVSKYECEALGINVNAKAIGKYNDVKKVGQQSATSTPDCQPQGNLRRPEVMDNIFTEAVGQARRASRSNSSSQVESQLNPIHTPRPSKPANKTINSKASAGTSAQSSTPSSSGSCLPEKSKRKRAHGKSGSRKKRPKPKPALEEVGERNLIVSVKYITYQELWDWLHGEDYIQFEDEPQCTNTTTSVESESGNSDTPEPPEPDLCLASAETSVEGIVNVDNGLVEKNKSDLVTNKLTKSIKHTTLKHGKEEDNIVEFRNSQIFQGGCRSPDLPGGSPGYPGYPGGKVCPELMTLPYDNSEEDAGVSPTGPLQCSTPPGSVQLKKLGKPSLKRFKNAELDERLIHLIEEANSMNVCLKRLSATETPSKIVNRDEDEENTHKLEVDSDAQVHSDDNESEPDAGAECIVQSEPGDNENKSEPEDIIEPKPKQKVKKKKKKSKGNYSCNFCGHISTRAYSLERHIRTHTGEILYSCKICGDEFAGRTDLLAHERSAHFELYPDFRCTSCNITFTCKTQLNVHNRAHHPEPKIPKLKIKLKRGGGQSPKIPKASSEHPPEFSCPHCSKLFHLRKGLQVHISLTHNKQENGRVKCPHCPRKFDLQRGLLTHMALVHKVKNPAAANITEHSEVVDNAVAYPCTYCPRVFFGLGDLQTHVQSHAINKNFPFTCLECPERFETVHELYQHKMIHTSAPSDEINEFSCSHCDLKFGREDDLVLHEVTHAREQPATCKITQDGSTQRYLFTVHDPAPKSQPSRGTRSNSYSSDRPAPVQGPSLQHNVPNSNSIHSHSMYFNVNPQTSCLPKMDSVTGSTDIRKSPGFNSDTTHFRNAPQQDVGANVPRRTSVIQNPSTFPPMPPQTAMPNTVHKSWGHVLPEVGGISSIPMPVTVQTFSCPSCTLKFVSQEFLDKHMATHVNERPYACPHCPDTFKYQSSLQLHQRIHAKTITFACVECPAVFGSEDDLTQHLKSHQGPPPPSTSASTSSSSASISASRLEWWKCRFCTKVYSSPAQLKAHGDAEHRSRPVSITQTQQQQERPGLPITIVVPSTLHDARISASTSITEAPTDVQTQEQIQTNRNRCSFCGKPYAFQSALLVHERIHTGERPYECTVCKMKFRGKRNLRKHVEKRHMTANTEEPADGEATSQMEIMADVNMGVANGIGDLESVIIPPNPDSDHFVMLPETGAFKFEAEERSEFEELEMEGLVFPEELAPILTSPVRVQGDQQLPLTSTSSADPGIPAPPQSAMCDEILGL